MAPSTLALVVALGCGPTSAAAATVHTTDFIPDGSRTNFVGFESLPDTGAGAPSHVEDGVRVDQIGGDGFDIWTTCASCFGFLDGLRAWYPNAGDFGFTRIMRVGDIDWELWDDGGLTQSGDLVRTGVPAGYLGFSGGGFDEIRLSDTSPGEGSLNALAVDSIELADGGGNPPSVPGPVSLALLGLGLLAWRLASPKLDLLGCGRDPEP